MKTITVSKATNGEIRWHNLPKGSYILHCELGFPTNIVCGVDNKTGNYTDSNNLGVTIRGSLGSCNIAVTDIKRTKIILQKSNYEVKHMSKVLKAGH